MKNARSNRPRPLSDLVPGISRGIFGRKSPLLGKMVAQWAQVAGEEIAARTMPLDLKFSKNGKEQQAVLHLAVQPGFALEMSYQKALLTERLNMFCGYAAIRDIRIVQRSDITGKSAARPFVPPPVTMQEEKAVEAAVSGIQENDLQTALKKLGKSIVSRQKQRQEQK